MNNNLFENKDQELILAQVEKDVDSIVDLESAKVFAEKYDSFAKHYVQKRKIIRESSTEHNIDYSKCALDELLEITHKFYSNTENEIDGLIMTQINYYRETIGLPILK
jgi:ASC-1-like (ASCH) protein